MQTLASDVNCTQNSEHYPEQNSEQNWAHYPSIRAP